MKNRGQPLTNCSKSFLYSFWCRKTYSITYQVLRNPVRQKVILVTFYSHFHKILEFHLLSYLLINQIFRTWYHMNGLTEVIIAVSHFKTNQLARLPPISLFGLTLVRSGRMVVHCGSHLCSWCS